MRKYLIDTKYVKVPDMFNLMCLLLMALFIGFVIYETVASSASDDPGPNYSNTYDCNSTGC